MHIEHDKSVGLTAPRTTRPLAEFILKVASRCNLNCSYCYVYNLGDTSWKTQPKFMSDEVVDAVLERMTEHAKEHNLPRFRVILHGGEPFLAGAKRLDRWCQKIRDAFANTSTEVSIGMQSNALLFTPEIGDVLLKHSVGFGVSIDGIPGVSDRQRVDHRGHTVGLKLDQVLKEIKASKYKELLGGFITVIDLAADPIETFEYLSQFDPPSIDFRPPTDNHERLPRSKVENPADLAVGQWFEKVFDHMLESESRIRVRLINGFVHALAGESISQQYIGNEEVWAGVIEADGSLELVDNLKTAADGMTKTGLSVFDSSLNAFSDYVREWLPTVGLDKLPNECQECAIGEICGGGFYARRYSSENDFRNPDVFCDDWLYLLPRMHSKLSAIMAANPDDPLLTSAAND